MNEQKLKYKIMIKISLFSFIRQEINLLTKLFSNED